ncbi:hypothetical protein J4464_05660 [Candidatus Woesearchaeota archaeon]|nr:hypothetical protein [Candidatus Woesearchaeota archaeon]
MKLTRTKLLETIRAFNDGKSAHQAGVKRKKKWIRYERRHSLTTVHPDWHQRPLDGPWVRAIIDDASRKILEVREGNNAATDERIQGMEQALQHGPIQQCISDHGCQFTTNKEGDCYIHNIFKCHMIMP